MNIKSFGGCFVVYGNVMHGNYVVNVNLTVINFSINRYLLIIVAFSRSVIL